MEKEEVIAKIKEAFRGVTLGAGISFNQATAIDDGDGPEEAARQRSMDEKEHWENVPNEVLNSNFSAPLFLDAEGMRFYLPALMIAELNHKYDFGFVDSLVMGSEHMNEKFSLLSENQREAVILFLNWCLAEPGFDYDFDAITKSLLDGYWRYTD